MQGLFNKGLGVISTTQEIYLSTLNRKSVFRFPYIHRERVKFSNTTTLETFENSLGKNLTLIGDPGLRRISINSFFPAKFYPFLPRNILLAPQCVKFMLSHLKEPLVVTVVSLEKTFTMKCVIETFEYNKKWNGDVDFGLSLKEYVGGTVL